MSVSQPISHRDREKAALDDFLSYTQRGDRPAAVLALRRMEKLISQRSVEEIEARERALGID